ncbi:MAG TPA: DUF5103 domain-containing protein [Parasegetibacter sp.]
MKNILGGFLILFFCNQLPVWVWGQKIYIAQVHSVKLFPYGNQQGFPVLRLGSSDRLELHFDDLDGDVKNYYYSFQLCNEDWTPALLNPFDFIRGYSQIRLNTYRNSSIALTKYTHYQAIIPDRNSAPAKSGNYLLKVFLDGDTSRLVFTRRFVVVEEKATVQAQVQQPFNAAYFRSHQKVQFLVNTGNMNITVPNQQIKVVVLQNDRWDNAARNFPPTFIRRNVLEYNTEQYTVFPAGKEWRWLDLRSFRLQSDRVLRAEYKTASTDIFLKPDTERSNAPVAFYDDINGRYMISVSENINPYWQGDYARVHFSYFPPGNIPYNGKELIVFGELTDYGSNPAAKMTFNADRGAYEASLFLKQGYYDYSYALVDPDDKNATGDLMITEGNNWETENTYTILVYYRPLGGRADELIGYTRVSSLFRRN